MGMRYMRTTWRPEYNSRASLTHVNVANWAIHGAYQIGPLVGKSRAENKATGSVLLGCELEYNLRWKTKKLVSNLSQAKARIASHFQSFRFYSTPVVTRSAFAYTRPTTYSSCTRTAGQLVGTGFKKCIAEFICVFWGHFVASYIVIELKFRHCLVGWIEIQFSLLTVQCAQIVCSWGCRFLTLMVFGRSRRMWAKVTPTLATAYTLALLTFL